MAFFRGDFYSEHLGMQTGAHFVIPENVEKNEELRVLYLLHGLSDNCGHWVRNTSAERYAVEHRTALVIPEVQRSFYTDMKYGPHYFSYVSKELPAFAQKTFGLSAEREKNMVAGLSMGGYGAMKCALTYPEQYAYCAAFSSACDTLRRTQKAASAPYVLDERILRDIAGMFGPELELPKECNLHYLAEKSASAPEKPKLFMTCGLQDVLLDENQVMAGLLKKNGYDIHYEEWEGNHTWEFWDTSLRKAFHYFFGAKEDGVKTPLSDGK